jgi:uncharacterized radical SAM superfamily Fe-S cluster-containing enzyme
VQNFFVNSVTLGGNIASARSTTPRAATAPGPSSWTPPRRCNLHCNGCWAANYTNDSKPQVDLTFDELNSIITQGKELGTYVYLYTGGEPTLRKRDLIRLCELHPDCFFSGVHQWHAGGREVRRRDRSA